MRQRLASFSPDLVCLTEAHSDFLAGWSGHSVASGPHWGYPPRPGYREVVLWSREPWTMVDLRLDSDLPKGRYVQARTDAGGVSMTVIGVVIPYHGAHVGEGRRDSTMWQEHGRFLDALAPILTSVDRPCVVAGDFNQRLPSRWVPRRVAAKLKDAFAALDIGTASGAAFDGRAPVDHIAADGSWTFDETGALSNRVEQGARLSDHFGVTAVLSR